MLPPGLPWVSLKKMSAHSFDNKYTGLELQISAHFMSSSSLFLFFQNPTKTYIQLLEFYQDMKLRKAA